MKHVILLMFILFVAAATNLSLGADQQREEIFPGQTPLSTLLSANGGFKGKIFLHDDIDSGHGEVMLKMLTRSVPRESVMAHEVYFIPRGPLQNGKPDPSFLPGFYTKKEGKRIKDGASVRVIHKPVVGYAIPGSLNEEGILQILKNHDILIVYGAGNFGSSPHLDMYQPDNPLWGGEYEYGGGIRVKLPEYHEVERHFQGGHAIMATHAVKKPKTFGEFASFAYSSKKSKKDLESMYQNSGEYIRHPLNARFGALKEYGFTVLFALGDWTWGTSNASAHVAAFAFYLCQLWDTTAEVLEVMQKTAIDIGEPGVDEEFGWGLINANHPIIWDRAMKRLEESLELCLLEDVALEEAVPVAREGLDVFHDIGNGKREIGFIFTQNKTKVAFATGSTVSPFGLSSKFLQQQSTVAQIGIAYAITDNIAVSGIYGRSGHEDADFNKGSIGINYQKHFSDSSGTLSLYAGHRSVWGSLGLPGYKAFNIAQTPFALRMVEARASFAWIF